MCIVVGEKGSHTFGDQKGQKCSVWVVKEILREERHTREELGFSLHGKEESKFFIHSIQIGNRILLSLECMKLSQ